MDNLDNVEKFSLRLVYSLDRLVKTKWVKLIFLFQAFHYCKHKEPFLFEDLNFIKMPNGPVFTNYDAVLTQLEQKKIVSVSKNPGYSMNMTTYLLKPTESSQPSPSAFKDEEEETYSKVFNYFKDKNVPWISDFTHKMQIWERPEMWDDLKFEHLFQDKPNIVEMLDQTPQAL